MGARCEPARVHAMAPEEAPEELGDFAAAEHWTWLSAGGLRDPMGCGVAHFASAHEIGTVASRQLDRADAQVV